MATLDDIAKAADVSPATVSRVLNGQGKGVREKAAKRAAYIRRLAQDMGYVTERDLPPVPSATPRSLHAGFIMRDQATSIYDFEFIKGAGARLAEAGCRLTIITLEELEQSRGRLHERIYDFLIVRHVPAEWRRQIEEIAERCVWLDTNEWRADNCVRRDEFHAGHLAATKLIEAGYEHLLYVGNTLGQEPHFNGIERRAGAERAAQEAGVPLIYTAITPGQTTAENAAEVTRLLSTRTGVVATDTNTAEWCFHRAMHAGLRAGPDYGLVSCCETLTLHWVWPELSRVSFDRPALGRLAAEMQLDRLADPEADCRSRKVQGEWIAGNTITSA